jgi:hypothetical protein
MLSSGLNVSEFRTSNSFRINDYQHIECSEDVEDSKCLRSRVIGQVVLGQFHLSGLRVNRELAKYWLYAK